MATVTKIYCDLCKREIKSTKGLWWFDVNPVGLWASDNRSEICASCRARVFQFMESLKS